MLRLTSFSALMLILGLPVVAGTTRAQTSHIDVTTRPALKAKSDGFADASGEAKKAWLIPRCAERDS